MDVMTVTGPVGRDELGFVLPHEHVFIDLVREYRGSGLLNDEHLACQELGALKAAGGGTLVDLTPDEIGRDPGRVIVGPTDSVPIPGYRLALVEQGCYISFDSIGTGSSYDTHRAVDYVLDLVRAGFGSQILLSHDVCLRDHLRATGGCGYAYLLTEFLPLLTAAGLDQEQVRAFVTDNPVAALAGTPD